MTGHYCSHRVLAALHQRVFFFACVVIQLFGIFFFRRHHTFFPCSSPFFVPTPYFSLSFKCLPFLFP